MFTEHRHNHYFVKSHQVTPQYGETINFMRETIKSVTTTKDIHSRWFSSCKNADICLFDVFKNTCVLMVIVVARFFPITAVVITRNQAQTAQLHYR